MQKKFYDGTKKTYCIHFTFDLRTSHKEGLFTKDLDPIILHTGWKRKALDGWVKKMQCFTCQATAQNCITLVDRAGNLWWSNAPSLPKDVLLFRPRPATMFPYWQSYLAVVIPLSILRDNDYVTELGPCLHEQKSLSIRQRERKRCDEESQRWA